MIGAPDRTVSARAHTQALGAGTSDHGGVMLGYFLGTAPAMPYGGEVKKESGQNESESLDDYLPADGPKCNTEAIAAITPNSDASDTVDAAVGDVGGVEGGDTNGEARAEAATDAMAAVSNNDSDAKAMAHGRTSPGGGPDAAGGGGSKQKQNVILSPGRTGLKKGILHLDDGGPKAVDPIEPQTRMRSATDEETYTLTRGGSANIESPNRKLKVQETELAAMRALLEERDAELEQQRLDMEAAAARGETCVFEVNGSSGGGGGGG